MSGDDIFKMNDLRATAGFALDGDHIELPAFAAFGMRLEVLFGGRKQVGLLAFGDGIFRVGESVRTARFHLDKNQHQPALLATMSISPWAVWKLRSRMV